MDLKMGQNQPEQCLLYNRNCTLSSNVPYVFVVNKDTLLPNPLDNHSWASLSPAVVDNLQLPRMQCDTLLPNPLDNHSWASLSPAVVDYCSYPGCSVTRYCQILLIIIPGIHSCRLLLATCSYPGCSVKRYCQILLIIIPGPHSRRLLLTTVAPQDVV